MSVKIVNNPYANEFKCHKTLDWMVVISYRKVKFFKNRQDAVVYAKQMSANILKIKERDATI